MKTPSNPRGYIYAVCWVAANDEPLDHSFENIRGYLTTHLVADIFKKSSAEVAQAVLDIRKGYVTRRFAASARKAGFDLDSISTA